MKLLDIPTDLRTSRLLKVIMAYQLADGDAPPTAAAKLVGLAKSVRLLAEAGEYKTALEMVAVIEKSSPDLGETWTELIGKHCDRVREAMRINV